MTYYIFLDFKDYGLKTRKNVGINQPRDQRIINNQIIFFTENHIHKVNAEFSSSQVNNLQELPDWLSFSAKQN